MYRNWKGISTNHLVYFIQDYRERLELLDIIPNSVIGFAQPSTHTWEEWIEEHREAWQNEVKSLEVEIEKRRKAKIEGVYNTNGEIIAAIKNALRIEDVLETYTEVIYHAGRWKYRCTLHGQDKEPSGSIRIDDQKAHCFACNCDGDIFDVVQWFERCDLPTAIAKLANRVGLNTKPLVPSRKRRDKEPF